MIAFASRKQRRQSQRHRSADVAIDAASSRGPPRPGHPERLHAQRLQRRGQGPADKATLRAMGHTRSLRGRA
eukprot:11212429-Alexandrium_andersonii.AAC.1